jgi:hypothetical protein
MELLLAEDNQETKVKGNKMKEQMNFKLDERKEKIKT